MPPFQSFPDAIWSRLKAWARIQARDGRRRSAEECMAQVEMVVRDITGYADSLRPEVVAFYAAEAAEMIARFESDFSKPAR